MEINDPTNPIISTVAGTGILGLLVTIGFAALAFVISAFFTALWVRLILVFMRSALDREYARMRMASAAPGTARVASSFGGPPLRDGTGPRDW